MDFAGLFLAYCDRHGVSPSHGSVALGYGKDIGLRWAKRQSSPALTDVIDLSAHMGYPKSVLLRAIEQSRKDRARRRLGVAK